MNNLIYETSEDIFRSSSYQELRWHLFTKIQFLGAGCEILKLKSVVENIFTLLSKKWQGSNLLSITTTNTDYCLYDWTLFSLFFSNFLWSFFPDLKISLICFKWMLIKTHSNISRLGSLDLTGVRLTCSCQLAWLAGTKVEIYICTSHICM